MSSTAPTNPVALTGVARSRDMTPASLSAAANHGAAMSTPHSSIPPTSSARNGEPPAAVIAPTAQVDAHMGAFVDGLPIPGNLADAVRYALLGGGKRLRPLLAWHCCEAVGGAGEQSLPSGAAVEFIHAFSLVHDDLPGLDNDDLRRGRPTLHKAAGEAMAILAGDAMLTMAFQTLLEQTPDPKVAARLCAELAQGTTGMIAGQVYDTLGGFAPGLSDRDRLTLVHRNKTGALIRAACRMGALAGGASDEALAAITTYGEDIGLMFQIVDDLIDVTQSAEHAGKRTNKDQDAGKLTYPGVLGIEASRAEVARSLAEAHGSLLGFGVRAGALRDLAEYLAVRTK